MKMSMNSSTPVTHIFHISEIAGELLQTPTFHFQVQRIAARGIQNEPDCHEKNAWFDFRPLVGYFRPLVGYFRPFKFHIFSQIA